MNDMLNDRLDDIFGEDLAPAAQPKALPQDEAAVRIRAMTFDEVCPKCRGTGSFIGYNGRRLGECFTCKGAGKRSFKTAPAVRAAARDRAAAAPVNRWDAFKAAHPAEAAFMDAKIADERCPLGYRDLLTSLRTAVGKYGDITGKQMAVVQSGVEREEAFKARRAQGAAARTEAAPVVDVSKLAAAFAARSAAGAKVAKLRFVGVTLSLKDASTIYVKSTDRKVEGNFGLTNEYLGKIVDGRFLAARACQAGDIVALQAAAADPLAAAVAYGRATSTCSCCGLGLTNALSVELGIGPICRDKWGF